MNEPRPFSDSLLPVTPPEGQLPETATAPIVAEIGKAALAIIESTVRAAIADQVKAFAKEAAEVVLEPDIKAGLRLAAVDAARVMVTPVEKRLQFATLNEFMLGWLAPIYRREVSAYGADAKLRWCPQWFRHGEALSRVNALWRAFESLRLEAATGMSTWWKDHADHHMPILMSLDGPFKYCSPIDGHREEYVDLPTRRLPAEDEARLFPDGHAPRRSGLILPDTNSPSSARTTLRFP